MRIKIELAKYPNLDKKCRYGYLGFAGGQVREIRLIRSGRVHAGDVALHLQVPRDVPHIGRRGSLHRERKRLPGVVAGRSTSHRINYIKGNEEIRHLYFHYHNYSIIT